MLNKILTAFLLMIGLCGPAAAADSVVRMGVPLLPPERGDPYTSIALPSALPVQAVYDSLTVMGADGTAQPWLATSWRMENPNTWVFTLREGVSFSNGEPFDADAVVAAVKYLLSPASREGGTATVSTQFERLQITGATARDAHTVAITLALPDLALPTHFYVFRIPAPKAWAARGRQDYSNAPIGTGPFIVEKWDEARITLKANSKSWRAPKIDRLEIIQQADQASRAQALVAGTIDIALGLSPEDKTELEAAGGRLYTWLRPEVAFMAFVTVKESPVKDVRVRRALNYAVNKEAIIAALLGGATKPATQFTPPQSFGFNPDLTPYPYDPDRARALLKEAGYGTGFELPTMMTGGDNNVDSVYQAIAEDLAKVGVHMEIRRLTPAKRFEYIYQGGWPGIAFDQNFSGFDPLNAYRIRSCAWPHAYHCDPAMMPLIDAAERAATLEERQRLTHAVLAHERDNPPGILLWQRPAFEGVGARIATFHVGEDFIAFHDISVKK